VRGRDSLKHPHSSTVLGAALMPFYMCAAFCDSSMYTPAAADMHACITVSVHTLC
jgi:hypothetical protein